jgi:nickel-dependent lactate racemase
MDFAVDFKPGVSEHFSLPEENFLFQAIPRDDAASSAEEAPAEETLIRNSLDRPVGVPPLEQSLKSSMRVVVLVDDITRPTPAAKILPHVMERIEKAGVPDDRIVLIMAPGTHRPMTDEELTAKLGAGIMSRYAFLNRDYQQTEKFQYLGETKSGTPIEVDREVLEADFVIGLGNITPHISAGWSGGAKIILPGICSARTTDMMHYTACVVQPVLEILGTCDNVPRKEMEEIAGKVGLNFIVNTVLDTDQHIRGVFSGHYIEAHRRGAEMAEELQVISIPRRADILVVSANPCHFDYWQGIKPYAYSHRAVRDGGVMILMLHGEEGLCGDAPSHDATLRKYMSWSFEDMKREVQEGRATDIVGMNVPMYHATLAHRVTNLIVTNYMTEDDIAVLGFEKRDSVQEALRTAFGILGEEAKVGIIPFGGETLTRVDRGISG